MEKRKSYILKRVRFIYIMVLLFALIIIFKIIYIQLGEGRELLKETQEKKLKYFTSKAIRGNIYAEDGNLIATSIPIFDIRMDVDSEHISDEFFNEKLDSLTLCLSVLFRNKSAYQYKREIRNARNNGNRYYLLKRNITYNQLKKVKKFPILRLGKYRGGLIIIAKSKRITPFKLLANRTIGYENKSENIFVGLEGAYSNVLSGTDGKRLMRKVNSGNWIPVNDKNEIEPENGKDIITTINTDIQDVAEYSLLEHLKEHEAYQGCAVLMEVKTGQIKAIANLRYDSVNDRYEEVYNYAIAESIEPGSTFKLASMLCLMEDNKVNLNDTIDIGKGQVVYYDRVLRDVHQIRDGKITVREAFEKSSNVGISKTIYEAYKDDPETFTNHFNKIGLNEPLNIEIPGEGKPLIKHPKDLKTWYGTTLPWMSIGYESKLTPIHILTFYNAIANNGSMVKPMFVKQIKDAGKTIQQFKKVVINNSICSEKTIDTLKSLLEGVVERGTARRLNNSIYKIAGKTGTAQIANKNSGYDKDNYNALFVGYFPADDPKYSCIVVVNQPSKGFYYGSTVAAPVFKDIADKVYAKQLDIPMKDDNREYLSSYPYYLAGSTKEIKSIIKECRLPADTFNVDSKWSVLLPDNDSIKLASRFIKQDVVPNVTGMSAKDAIFILENLGLRTQIQGKGTVIKQSIKQGQIIKGGESIILTLETS